MNDIKVSVFCATYNHEKYIRQCLDSILSQKTDFRFEVLVHDDASTDHTTEIIREYQKKYPDIIIPVFQKVNQYSQNIHVSRTFLLPKARGEYIAICEGDDYWIDDSKLQLQVDLMDKHPEIDMCTHGAVKVKEGKKIGYISPNNGKKIFTPKEVIHGGGGMFATNSILYRKSMRKKMPLFVQFFEFDYSLQIWGSLRGGLLYIPEIMSAYRMMSDNSWSLRMKKNPNAYIKHLKRVEQMESVLVDEINDRYRNDAIAELTSTRFSILEAEGNYRLLKLPEYVNCFRKFSFRRKIKFFLKRLSRMMRGGRKKL